MRIAAIAFGTFILGALVAVGAYRHFVPLPNDAMARGEAFEPENAVWLYQNAPEIFPTRNVARSEQGQPFELVEGALDGFVYAYGGKDRTLEAIHEEMEATGLVILHNGKIVHEAYAQGAGPGTKFSTYSVAKSITSTLVGAAVHDGLIETVDDQLTKYLPGLKGTSYEGVSIKDALQMSSGVKFDANGWETMEDTIAFITESTILGNKKALDIAKSFPRAAEPGTLFNYNTAETQILVELIRAVTSKNAATYLEEKLWRPLGMSHDAAWIIDNPGAEGTEMGGVFFNAALRDWARIGQLMEQDGIWQGERILPEGWVARATTSNEPHIMPGKVHPNPKRGYGWHWWTYADGGFSASGAYGQSIYVDQENDFVVARASAWPKGWVAEYDDQSLALYKALATWFSSKEQVALQ